MTVTLPEAIKRLRDFNGGLLKTAMRQAFYRSLDAGRHKAVEELKRSKIGSMVERRGNVQLLLGLSSRKKYSTEALAAMKASVIPLIVRRSEMKQKFTGNLGLSSGLETAGFASLIQTGGRTKAHQIKRIREGGYSRGRTTRQRQVDRLPPLTFQVGGRWVSKRVVTHPGSKLPRNPILEAGARTAERAMDKELTRSVGEAIKKAGLDG